MNFYTFYTDSHKKLYEDYFLSSFPKDEFNLVCEKFKQECPSGTYREEGWNLTMSKKIQLIIDGIKESWGEYIVHGDCDIQFFPPGIKEALLEEIQDNDIAFQSDGSKYCAGFFICKANEESLYLFNQVKLNLNFFPDDQEALNHLISQLPIKRKTLSARFYTAARDNEWRVYAGEEDIKITTDNILMHHANYTMGLENKIKLLEKVKSKVLSS